MFFVITFYLIRHCCYPENVYGRIDNKVPDVFQKQLFKKDALKAALQEQFRKKESKFWMHTESSYLFYGFIFPEVQSSSAYV